MKPASEPQKIPLARPDLTDAERRAVCSVLESSVLSGGPRLLEFERLFAEHVGTARAVGVSSGTAGLHLAMSAAGVGPGDMVLTTPFSFVASANVILYRGAVPVFVDVEESTGNLDPRRADEAASEIAAGRLQQWLPPRLPTGFPPGGRLKALLPVHAFGQPAEMDSIAATARRFDLPVIEDACEALGSEYRGRKVGRLGDLAVFAFYPNKQITTGEGGMIVTDRLDWEQLCRSLRNQGRDGGGSAQSHARLGYNYRLDEFGAALGVVQLGRLEEMNARRRRVTALYNQRLEGHPLIETPRLSPSTTKISWFLYVVRLRPPARRERVMDVLQSRGIPSRAYFEPIHLQPFYRETFQFRPGQFPVAERLGAVSLALPYFSRMTEAEVKQVCDALIAAVS